MPFNEGPDRGVQKLALACLNNHTIAPHTQRLPTSLGRVVVVPYRIPGDQFARIAGLLDTLASYHSSGLEPYTIGRGRSFLRDLTTLQRVG